MKNLASLITELIYYPGPITTECLKNLLTQHGHVYNESTLCH